ncbi:Txe/YoeB family addiction module toxin [Mycobacterium sp. M1]|uniref:Endoribonuclease YoeB n=1 Tax=Mycolicibacter acidiphilus TaxID=2835306 RepID=A0ABS5RCM6_9MYCO|nr:Txe/YoeB family addiction module toxin [Mycolicibacter acidiphilus]MBS9532038.1 Txe/YoeB family addiction module toxin [Mycolicibacter acidiphilus]
MRRLAFHAQGWEDVTHWLLNDRTTAKRILRLLSEIQRDPFVGIGKPEPLRHSLPGTWSRRITDEHRLVYLVTDEPIVVLQARYHY